MGLAASLFGLLLSVSPVAAQERAGPRYVRISKIRYRIDEERKVGSVKVGVLCLPNGSLRWREVKLPGADEVREVIAARLKEAGTPISLVDGPAGRSDNEAAYLEVAIENATFRLCMPGMQMLTGKPKLHGVMAMQWKLSGSGLSDVSVISTTVAIDLAVDPRRTALPILHAFADSAEEFAKRMAH